MIKEVFATDEDNPKVCQIETIVLRQFLLIWSEGYVNYKYKTREMTEEEKNKRLRWIKKLKKLKD